MKRAYKLQEFVAHTSNVNCVQIGRKSAGVFVTGGEDKKVNVWAIGRPTAVLSLAGHQSSVECVAFDSGEEAVVAGATGGTIKLWDLEQAKVIRTMTGHRSTCSSIDFHPFGDFFASGSSDTTLKVWDIRRKTCISTYKGHSRGVTTTVFSPDGRLVASSTHNGEVKIWDLTAGKLLHEFQHNEAVTGIVYHPSELLLATSSADRTVKWWDLETLQSIDSTVVGTTGVRSIVFPADGSCLLAATQDGLTCWGWEPVRRLDTVDIPWAKVQDMSVNQQDGKLVACSCNNSFVGVWVVDLTKIRPFASHGSLQSSGAVRADITVQDSSALSPALVRATKAPATPETSTPSNVTPVQAQGLHGSSTTQMAAFDTSSLFSPRDETDPPAVTPPGTVSQQSPGVLQASRAMALSPVRAGLRGLVIEAAQPTVTGLDVASFMPPHLTPRQGTQTDMRDADFLAEALSKHGSMMSILGSRQASLRIAKSLWQRGDVRGALSAVLQSADTSVVMDVLSTLQQAPQLLKLEHCPDLVQCLERLILATHKAYNKVGLDTAASLLKTFGDVIHQTCQQSIDRMGIDVMFEERKERCTRAKASFRQLRDPLQQLQGQDSVSDAAITQLQEQIAAL